MANIKTMLDQWSVKDLEDNSAIKVTVDSCTELGNSSLPGLQIICMGQIVNFEPNAVEKWCYQAGKQGITEYLLEDKSWAVHEDQYVKFFLVNESPVKARVTVKTRSSKPVTKDYVLPFDI